jgi:hypothetical protein
MNTRKKIKCIKCGLRFKDREDPEDGSTVYRELCLNCRFIWRCIAMVLQSFPPKINREVRIDLEHVIIKKKINGHRKTTFKGKR